MAKYCLTVNIKKEGEFYLASCPDWSDCYAQGKTIDEATTEIMSVASAMIDLYEDEGMKIPLKKAGEAKSGKLSFDVPVFAAA